MHNLMIPTESSICPALVLNIIYHTLQWLSHGEWGLPRFTCSERREGKNKVFFNRDKEVNDTEYYELSNPIKTYKQIIFFSLRICETFPPQFFWSAIVEFSFWGLSAQIFQQKKSLWSQSQAVSKHTGNNLKHLKFSLKKYRKSLFKIMSWRTVRCSHYKPWYCFVLFWLGGRWQGHSQPVLLFILTRTKVVILI